MLFFFRSAHFQLLSQLAAAAAAAAASLALVDTAAAASSGKIYGVDIEPRS